MKRYTLIIKDWLCIDFIASSSDEAIEEARRRYDNGDREFNYKVYAASTDLEDGVNPCHYCPSYQNYLKNC